MRCKPGDAAFVTNSVYPDVDGRVVNVIRWDGEHSDWEVEFIGPVPASVAADFGDDNRIYAEDRYLIPIGGIPDTEHTDTEQPIKEVA